MKLLFLEWLNKIDETNSSEYANRRRIYTDTINSFLKWTDFQVRPNFIIAAII
ncbi:unnamed protein product, partial [Rotaria socialis]